VIDQNAEGMTVTASAVTTSSINYQGRLTDTADEPLSGSYTMTFRLYEVASGGMALDTDSHSVVVTDGLFNTEIDFGQEHFDGRGLWLGVTVGIDSEMSPRQELRPVPYALSLKPGAYIVGASSVALQAESTHTAGSGIRGDATATSGTNYGVVGESKSPDGYGGYFYNHEGGIGVYGKGTPGGYFTTDQGGTSWADRTAGVDVATTHDYSYGVQAHTAGDNSNGVAASTSGGNSHGVSASTTGDNSNGVSAYTAGNNSNGVWAYSDKHYGVYGKGGKYGGYFTTNQAGTSGNQNAGVNATTTYDYSAGVQAHTTGDYSTGVDAVTSGDHSLGVQASTTGENSPGVDAYTTGDDSDGVSASAWGENSVGVRAYSVKGYGVYGKGKSGGYFTTNQAGTSGDRTEGMDVETIYDYSQGIRAHTTGYKSRGVYAQTSGDYSSGFSAHASGDKSHGVYAYSTKGYGVYGKGKSGGYFTTNQAGTSWDDKTVGVNVTTAYDYSDGVRVSTDGVNSEGVYARTTGDRSDGVYASTTGDDSTGVHAYSLKGYGVYGAGKSGGYFTTNKAGTSGDHTAGVNAGTTYDYSDGVRARTAGYHSAGVSAHTTGDQSAGVYAYSKKANAIYADTGKSDHKYGVRTPDKMCAEEGYDTSCSDIAEYFSVAEEPEPGTVMVIGEDSKLQCSSTAYDTTVAGIVSTAPGVSLGTNDDGNEGEKLIAVAGRVPCKVDATYAPIMPGDLLTTSDTPGHAMKAADPQIGTILGKALEPLDSGTGVIEVLVTLQ
jgi:hypothetical protein